LEDLQAISSQNLFEIFERSSAKIFWRDLGPGLYFKIIYLNKVKKRLAIEFLTKLKFKLLLKSILIEYLFLKI
jgi:hypothetical protein